MYRNFKFTVPIEQEEMIILTWLKFMTRRSIQWLQTATWNFLNESYNFIWQKIVSTVAQRPESFWSVKWLLKFGKMVHKI